MFSSNYNVIRKSPLFSGMDDGQLSASLSLLSAGRAEYCKNSLIISAGSRMYRFALVLSGVVQVSFTDIDGNEVLMASVSAGDTFGESLCWLGREEIPVSVTAQTDVCLLWLIPDAIKNESTPLAHILQNRLLSMLAQKTLSMNDRVQVLSKPSIRQKLITYFSQCAAQYGSKTFIIPFDRETLSLYLGVNRSALSRELSAMQKEGIIEFYKNSFKILK